VLLGPVGCWCSRERLVGTSLGLGLGVDRSSIDREIKVYLLILSLVDDYDPTVTFATCRGDNL
jgi:hypothetical protein